MMDDKIAADSLWEAFQFEAQSTNVPLFQRRALSAVGSSTRAFCSHKHTSKGQLLSQQFAVNSGVKYKYIVDTLSLSFEESPECIRDARDTQVSAPRICH